MKSPSIEELDKEIDAILPGLDSMLYDALPVELRIVFIEYIFLSLFRANFPKTPLGIQSAVRTVRKVKKMLAAKPVVVVGEPKPIGGDLKPFDGDLEVASSRDNPGGNG
jgi:hypothetical protein